jgi:hypothetical protein
MDLRLTLALGFAGGFAVTATPALANVADKGPRTRLDTQAPGKAASTPGQSWPQREDLALDGGVGDQAPHVGRAGDR